MSALVSALAPAPATALVSALATALATVLVSALATALAIAIATALAIALVTALGAWHHTTLCIPVVCGHSSVPVVGVRCTLQVEQELIHRILVFLHPAPLAPSSLGLQPMPQVAPQILGQATTRTHPCTGSMARVPAMSQG